MLVERGLIGRPVVKIAEHQARTLTADLADFARRHLRIRIVLAPNADLEPLAGAAAGFDDTLGRIIGECILMRAGFGHAEAALRHDTPREQLSDNLRRRGSSGKAEAADRSQPLCAAGT